jgi:hypothetical protein
LQPVWKIRNSYNEFTTEYVTLAKPASYSSLNMEMANSTTFTNFWSTLTIFSIRPLGTDDHYESRIWGKDYKRPLNYDISWNLGSDSRKKFRYSHTFGIVNTPKDKNFDYFIQFSPRMRFSNQFMLTFSTLYEKNMHNYGWVKNIENEYGDPTIYFGCRDITTVNNVLSLRYIFSTSISLTMRARHYWSKVKYRNFFVLQDEGKLAPADYQGNADRNFNALTVDLNFSWIFAPGSELSLVWKNDITKQDDEMVKTYFDDIHHTLSLPQTNSFSIKFLYYIDYLYMKKWFSGK